MSQPMAEQDNPNNTIIAVATLGTIALFTGLVITAMQMHGFAVTEAQQAAQSKPSLPLQKLKQEESMKLGRYQWVDQANGVVRIPLERAVELTIRDWPTRPASPVAIPGLTPAPAAPAPEAPPPAPEKAPAKKGKRG